MNLSTKAKRKITHMICNSEREDKKHNRYDEKHHYRREDLFRLMEEQKMRCIYCEELMTLDTEQRMAPNLMTVERTDNSLGHIVSNINLACLGCNRVSQWANTDDPMIKRFEGSQL